MDPLLESRTTKIACLDCGRGVYFTRHGVCEDCENELYWDEDDYGRD